MAQEQPGQTLQATALTVVDTLWGLIDRTWTINVTLSDETS
jgi:hypothetical protein